MKTTKYALAILLFSSISYGAMAQKAKDEKQKYGCSAEQPKAKVFIEDTTPGRGLADNYYLWDNGKTLYVKFLSGSKQMQQKVKTIAKEWEKYANIKFEFVEVGASHIRVNLDDKGGHNSVIGTLAISVPQDEKTVNFDTTDFKTYATMYRTVLHEFGHAIGLLHEHYSPVSGIHWNKQAVYEDLKKTQGWTKEMVDVNLFSEYNLTYTNGTKYDPKSIMHYPIFPRWTTDGYSVNWNNQLSQGDIALVESLYPKSGKRLNEAPRFSVSDFAGITVNNNANKQGISIFPSFNINTSGRPARVYFIASFYDEDGNPIRKETQSYNVAGVASTYVTYVLEVDKKIPVNKVQKNDVELFIPYSELPVIKGKNNFQVLFSVFLLDDKELKPLYQSKRKVFNFIKS